MLPAVVWNTDMAKNLAEIARLAAAISEPRVNTVQ